MNNKARRIISDRDLSRIRDGINTRSTIDFSIREDILEVINTYQSDKSEIAILEAENEGLKKDAERYRKLRQLSWRDGGIIVLESVLDAKIGSMTLALERLDGALDYMLEVENLNKRPSND